MKNIEKKRSVFSFLNGFLDETNMDACLRDDIIELAQVLKIADAEEIRAPDYSCSTKPKQELVCG